MLRFIGKSYHYLVLIFVVTFSAFSLGATAQLLDGKTFTGPTGIVGESAEEQEVLTFNHGELYSESCAPWGFKSGAYTLEQQGETLYFTATTLSPDNGKIVWHGKVKGDAIEASYIWTKERWWWKDARQEKWFKGTLKTDGVN